MKYNRLSFLSVFIVLGLSPMIGDAAIRVGNAARSNAQGYQQVNTQRYNALNQTQGAVQAQQAADLPINVTDAYLAQQIQNGDESAGVTVEDLDSCSMIYPNGEFEWARPTIGTRAGGSPTCTSVIELRIITANGDKQYKTLARANLAAGDSFDCNISNFPNVTIYEQEVESVQFPADAQPTVEDVIAVMNEEQKQNAAIKIIGGAVLGGLGGNFAGKNEAGKDGILGGGKDKITSTVIGAIGGAGLMTASTYSGKVAGDMILSTGVNAAAGATIGNMVTDGDAVLRIEKCVIDNTETKCLWGFVNKRGGNTSTSEKEIFVFSEDSGRFVICDKEENEGYKNCATGLVSGSPKIEGYTDAETGTSVTQTFSDILKLKKWEDQKDVKKYCLDSGIMKEKRDSDDCKDSKGNNVLYLKVDGVSPIENRIPVMVPVTDADSAFGYTRNNWNSTDAKKKPTPDWKKIVGRNSKGEAIKLSETYGEKDFMPMYQEAEDGGIIEFDNKARLKGTLTGAGIGGAAGAFTAYQGAQTEIDDRYVAAVREYKDSLQKFYCGTGERFLSFYNDSLIIPLQNQE